MKVSTIILLLLAAPKLGAQDAMTLKEAIDTAVKQHPSMEAGAARIAAAGERVKVAGSGYLPRVDYTESWTRSDNPVFVFSSLLTQHQFSEQNFQIGALNRPGALDNFQSQLAVTQSLYDGGLTRARVGSAQAAVDLAKENTRATRIDLTAAVIRAYFGILLADANLRSAEQSVRSAGSDLERAQSIRASGMSTDADVLSIRVHLASMRQQEIRRKYDSEVARATLNELLGAPLDTPRTLTTALEDAHGGVPPRSANENTAVSERPEIKGAQLRMRLAAQESAAGRAAQRPRAGVRVAFEADRRRFVDRGGANWLASAYLEWNLFNGFSDRARVAQAGQEMRAASADLKQADAAVRIAVRRAEAELKSANEQLAVAEATVAMADESLRITKNRFENGMNTVTDLLRNETAALDARTQRLGAIYGQRMAEVNLEYAIGTLK